MPYCPLCNNSYTKKVLDYENMHIYKCKSCSMMFQDEKRPVTFCEFFCVPVPEIDTGMNIARGSFGRITSYLQNKRSPLKVLEIGTGFGALAALFLENGFLYQGIEPSEFLFKKAVEIFPELKDKVKNCFFDSVSLPKSYFDLIVMIDTFEHIPVPLEFLEKLKDYLAPEGAIYVEIPDESLLLVKGYLRRMFGIYSGFPTHPGHISLFTRETVGNIFVKAGFDIEKLTQITILGDYERVKLILGQKALLLAKVISGFFRLTKLDMLLRQGNISVLCSLKKS